MGLRQEELSIPVTVANCGHEKPEAVLPTWTARRLPQHPQPFPYTLGGCRPSRWRRPSSKRRQPEASDQCCALCEREVSPQLWAVNLQRLGTFMALG